MVDITILGEPGTKSNSRRIVRVGKFTRLIKSKKALAYQDVFEEQCPTLPVLLTGDIAIHIDVWYASRRPDLAAMELIKDLLEGKVYLNDRQVKYECSRWHLRRGEPSARIRILEIDSGDPEDPSRGFDPVIAFGLHEDED
jgi:hypothetical protein